MKKSFLKTVLLSAVVVFAFKLNAHSQDYVVTLKGDTIPCQISVSLTGTIKYKTDNPADVDKIKHSRIRDYYIARKKSLRRFVFVNRYENEWEPDLMKVVENGKISLYETIETNPPYGSTSTLSTVWYVGKSTDSVRVLKTSAVFGATSRQSREDELGQMLMDNKDVYEKYIADKRFNFEQIRNIVHLYNTGGSPKN